MDNNEHHIDNNTNNNKQEIYIYRNIVLFYLLTWQSWIFYLLVTYYIYFPCRSRLWWSTWTFSKPTAPPKRRWRRSCGALRSSEARAETGVGPVNNGTLTVKNRGFTVKNGDFTVRHEDFTVKHGDFIIKHDDFSMKTGELTFRNGDFTRKTWWFCEKKCQIKMILPSINDDFTIKRVISSLNDCTLMKQQWNLRQSDLTLRIQPWNVVI